jgi:predicted aconitase with swiveling domain
MADRYAGSVLVAGERAKARALVLDAPVSFWGGVSPETGEIIDRRHPQSTVIISGTVLCLPGTIGSSGASSVLLELVHRGKAPAAIVMDHPDAILLLGLISAREMGWEHPIAVRLEKAAFDNFRNRTLSIETDGTIAIWS